MDYLFPILIFSSLVISTYSAIYYERQHVMPGYENFCYDKETNNFYKKGEEMIWRLKGCGRKICRGSNGMETVYAEVHTCGRLQVPPECQVEVNPDLPYPKCCERVVCPDFAYLDGNTT